MYTRKTGYGGVNTINASADSEKAARNGKMWGQVVERIYRTQEACQTAFYPSTCVFFCFFVFVLTL